MFFLKGIGNSLNFANDIETVPHASIGTRHAAATHWANDNPDFPSSVVVDNAVYLIDRLYGSTEKVGGVRAPCAETTFEIRCDSECDPSLRTRHMFQRESAAYFLRRQHEYFRVCNLRKCPGFGRWSR
jgi:hypothetical protein